MSVQNPANTPKNPKSRRSRIIRILGILAILLVVLILTAPLIVANTGLRDPVINKIVESPSVTASSDSASFGWFSHLSIHGLRLQSANDRFDVRIEDITADGSPLQLWSRSPDLGTITVNKPHVQLELPLDVTALRPHRLEPTFTAIVNDAALTVRLAGQDDPVIDVDDINLTARVEQADEGRLLTLDPVVIFNRHTVSPKLVNHLLQLFDPSLGDTPQVSGEISLALDKLRIPIGIPREELMKRMELEGSLTLHHLSTEVKNPMRQALVQMVADMNGKQASDVVRLVEDAKIHFQVRDGRLHHDGLRIGFPDIDPDLQISSRGSVGLDRTLDLFVELPRLDKTLRKEKGPAQCHITGTIDNPRVGVQDASLVLRGRDGKEPILEVAGVNLNMQVENADTGRVLAVEPMEVLKNEKLSNGLASGLLKLIAPDLGDRQVDGKVSLSFQKLRIPLGVDSNQLAKRLEAEGKLTLHQVSSEVKRPMCQALIKLIADMNGKQPPDAIHLVADSEINFQIRDGRLHHDGLRVGFPDIDPELVVSSRGSIGVDETLDLHLDLPRLRKEKRDKGPIQCHITGTIDQPKITVPSASLVVQLTGGDKPTLRVDDIDLSFGVETAKDCRMLALEAVTIFKKQKLTPEMGDELLHLVAPTLGDLSGVQGEISLSFDTFRVPLGVPISEFAKRVELAGKLELHHISIDAKTPLVDTMVKLLADMHGKKPTEVVRIVEDSEIRFEVRDGRMSHKGLRIGFPDISPDLLATSSGSVGFDKSLDLVLEVPRILVKDKTDPKAKAPVRFRITGFIGKPIVTEINE